MDLEFIQQIRQSVDYYRFTYTSCEKRIYVGHISFLLELQVPMELIPSISIEFFFIHPPTSETEALVLQWVDSHKEELLKLFDAKKIKFNFSKEITANVPIGWSKIEDMNYYLFDTI
jgi:hypothetical protein